MANTYKFVIPKVIFTVASATLTAYGFARFNFCCKCFPLQSCCQPLFLPQVVLNVPQYILFDQVGWLDSYLPIIIPSLLAGDTYFVYMLIQFLRGIQRELEEAAREIDGCGIMQRLWVCDRSYAETVHCLLRIVPVYVGIQRLLWDH